MCLDTADDGSLDHENFVDTDRILHTSSVVNAVSSCSVVCVLLLPGVSCDTWYGRWILTSQSLGSGFYPSILYLRTPSLQRVKNLSTAAQAVSTGTQ